MKRRALERSYGRELAWLCHWRIVAILAVVAGLAIGTTGCLSMFLGPVFGQLWDTGTLTLLAEWEFAGVGTTALDTSGYGHDGDIVGAIRANPPERSDALQFDGSDDYVRVPDAAVFRNTAPYGIAAWVYITGGQGNFRQIISKTTTANGHVAFELCVGDHDKFEFRRHQSVSSVIRLYGDATVELDHWYHVAVLIEQNLATLYVDGVAEDVAALAGTIYGDLALDDIYLGFFNLGVDPRPFDGYIDDVRIWGTP